MARVALIIRIVKPETGAVSIDISYSGARVLVALRDVRPGLRGVERSQRSADHHLNAVHVPPTATL
jgi:hypothetical protein